MIGRDPQLLLLGDVTIDDGVHGEVRRLAAGITLSADIRVNQGADGPAGDAGLVSAGDAAGGEGCRETDRSLITDLRSADL